MRRLIRFSKAEATGNDFIIIRAKELDLDTVEGEVIEKLCDRHFGIGADGAIMISSDGESDFRYDYYNANGFKSTMCGNGSRAAVLAANALGMVKRNTALSFRASDGLHRARIYSEDRIRVEILTDNSMDRFEDNPFGLPEDITPVAFMNTGVPHLVLKVEGDLGAVEVLKIAPELRAHPRFPQGTNVNFVKVVDSGKLHVRTYERGVEGETLSCGTGVTAAALAFWKTAPGISSMEIETRGGPVKVLRENGSIFLEGPARLVFVGQCLLNL